ncbi:MAG: DEAD/DEAH box helicase, partial [Elusimicrobiales bacterium]|nr:DEAD/DEAH box helicase [Elusimicrobiales bacterium]
MKIDGIVNEAACIYFVFKNLKNNNKSSLIFIEDESDLLLFWQTANSLKELFFEEIDIIEFDSSLDSCARLSKSLLDDSKRFIAIASVKAVDLSIFDPSTVKGKSFRVGSRVKRNEFVNLLIENGFKKTDFVELKGEFATRGSVVDFFNPGDEYPIRVFFDDDRIDSVKKFEIDTQNTFDFMMEFNILNISQRTQKILDLDLDFYCYNLDIENCCKLTSLVSENQFSFENIYFNSFNDFLKELDRLLKKGFLAHIYYINEREGAKIYSLIEESKINLKNIYFHLGYLRKGFYCESEKVFIVSSNEIFGREFIFSTRKNIKKSLSINQISPGDYIVHADYGIGIYNGIIDYTHRDEWGNVYTTECLEIKYAGGDKLYVPLEEFNKIEKYIGDSNKVKLSSLNSLKWTKIKENIRKEIEKIAHQIVKIDAQRRLIKIKPMQKTEMEDDFVSDFIYEETPDQKKAINDVLKDLESERPANRVIVGDVGFGKTEVAMRAAFRAVSNGWQVCVLCPTTILVEQHFRTFSMRFKRFPFNIASLSRFTISSDEKRIKNNIERGVIDILIGTHKVLSENIR